MKRIEIAFPSLAPDHNASDSPVYWHIEAMVVKQNGDCEKCPKENTLVFSFSKSISRWYCLNCCIEEGGIWEELYH